MRFRFQLLILPFVLSLQFVLAQTGLTQGSGAQGGGALPSALTGAGSTDQTGNQNQTGKADQAGNKNQTDKPLNFPIEQTPSSTTTQEKPSQTGSAEEEEKARALQAQAERLEKEKQAKEKAEKEALELKKRNDAFAAGSKLYQAKRYDAAIKLLDTASKSPADDGEAGILLGYCYYGKHQYDKALKQYLSVAEHGKLISVKNKAQKLAHTLDCYIKGICPGNCLKPSMPGWRKMKVPGTPDRLVWMVYPYLDPAGKGGSEYWSNDHMGEVIEYVNGRPVDKGICPICGGTGKVKLDP